ncbi:MAG: hypothetical protein ABFR62_07190 [Bacteroidota bacterium]
MKIIVRFAITSVAALSLALVTGCGSKKATTPSSTKYEAEPSTKDEVVANLPCSGSEFFSADKDFRGSASGESLDQMTARKKALSNAKAQLAGDVNSVMQTVGGNYIKSSGINNKELALEHFEQHTRAIVDRELRDVSQICEKQTKVESTGKYKYYVAIELSGYELVDAYNETLSKDEIFKAGYSYEKFKQAFDEEMVKYTRGN